MGNIKYSPLIRKSMGKGCELPEWRAISLSPYFSVLYWSCCSRVYLQHSDTAARKSGVSDSTSVQKSVSINSSAEIIRLLTCTSVCPLYSKTEATDRHRVSYALPRIYCSCAVYTAQGPTILTCRCSASSRPRSLPFTSFRIHSHPVT
jgi:hypothetical protein